MVVRPAGRVMVVRELQPVKAAVRMVARPAGRVMMVRELQPKMANLPMVVSEAGGEVADGEGARAASEARPCKGSHMARCQYADDELGEHALVDVEEPHVVTRRLRWRHGDVLCMHAQRHS